MRKLEGKVAIVTGAGQGIGKGMALAFAREGAMAVIADIEPGLASEVEGEIRQLGEQALGVSCDIGKKEDVDRMVEEAVKAFGTVDILVNNAQSKSHFVSTEDIEEAWWDETFRTGPRAALLCCKAVFPYMKDRGGKIVNIASGVGISGRTEGSYSAYAAAKEAMRGFTRAAARDWGKYNINVNVICPAAMTPRMRSAWSKYPPEVQQQVLSRAAIPRWGETRKGTSGARPSSW